MGKNGKALGTRGILFYRSVPLLKSDELFFHLLLSYGRKESIIKALRELVPSDGFIQSRFFS